MKCSIVGLVMVFMLCQHVTGFCQQHDAQNKHDSAAHPVVVSESLAQPDFISFSLTDSVLFRNFDKEIGLYKNKTKSVLITVAKGESEQRLEFVSLFYEIRSRQKSIRKAYKESLDAIHKRYPHPDFKSRLFIKEE